jgi:peptidoglycan/xylan/chitin deacetylase (PgdA/CDA1 family)
MSLKSKISPMLHWAGYASGFSARQAHKQRVMRILMYHGVGTQEYPAEVFGDGLDYLSRNFKVVPLGDIIQKLLHGQEFSGNEMALTFDDGRRNNFTRAYPLLQKYKLPATFFICPGLVDNKQWLWNHDARERLKSISPMDRHTFAAALNSPTSDPNRMVEWMKSLPKRQRVPIQEKIFARTAGFIPTGLQREKFDLMSWDEIGKLDPKLITIGSHSSTHPILSQIEPDEIEDEIVQSRWQLETRLQRPVEFFCYPNGNYNAAVLEAVRRTYTGAVTTDFRAAHNHEDPHQLPRISAAEELPLLAWRLHRPSA